MTVYHTNLGLSKVLITNLDVARTCLTTKEVCLDTDKLERSNLKCTLLELCCLKIILSKQLLLGKRRLLDWLNRFIC